MKVLMEISYVGSEFCGWQVQRNALSVQKTVQTAAETLLKSPCAVTGCSRTDAGVHARQYFCTLENENLDRFPLDRLPLALNCLLPETVGVRDAFPVEKDFHPRYRALGKEYEYLIHGGRLKNPFLSERAFFCGRMPDTDCMQREAQDLVGTHDFSSFCASGGKVEDKTRTVYFCRVEKLPGEQVSLRICADGFLYNMVRIIAGTLLECGLDGRKSCGTVLSLKDRRFAGRTLPAQGLYLDRVFYRKEDLEMRIAEVNGK